MKEHHNAKRRTNQWFRKSSPNTQENCLFGVLFVCVCLFLLVVNQIVVQKKIQLQVQVDNQIRKESDQARRPTPRDYGDHGSLPFGTPHQSHMPGGHPPYNTWVVEKKNVLPGSQPAPLRKIIAHWYPESPSSHPKEMYLLCETNGVYTMNYWYDPEQDHSGKYWWYPVNVASSRSITSYMDLTNGSKLIITLIDPNTKPQPISRFRPNGNFWKTNSVGDLEIWNSNDVIETITNFNNYSKSD